MSCHSKERGLARAETDPAYSEYSRVERPIALHRKESLIDDQAMNAVGCYIEGTAQHRTDRRAGSKPIAADRPKTSPGNV